MKLKRKNFIIIVQISERLALRARCLERNIRLGYWIRLLVCSFAFPISTIVLLWQENGLSLPDVFLLQTCFSIASALLEIPTGYYADISGRKRSMVAGSIMLCTGALAYCFAEHFFGFLAGEILLAVGFSLTSGADEALVHDSLAELGREEEFGRTWGKINLFTFFGVAIFATVGSLLSLWSLRLPSLFALIGMCCLLLTCISIVEPHREESVHAPRISELWDVGKNCLLHNRRIQWLIFFPALLFAFIQCGFWLYQPYLKKIELNQRYFGLVYAFFNICAGVTSWHATQLFQGWSERKLAKVFIVVISLSFALMAITSNILGCVAASLHQFVRGSAPVIFSMKLHREISSTRRATIISLKNMIGKIVYASMLLPLSLYSRQMDVHELYAVLALATLSLGWIGAFRGWTR